MCISQIQAIKSRVQEIMKVLFNLTIRKRIWGLPEYKRQACRRCNRCVSLSVLPPIKLFTVQYETGSYHCQYSQTDVDGVISESIYTSCTQFKPLRLKKL